MAWGPKLLPASIVKVREQKIEKWAILSSDIRKPWLKKYKIMLWKWADYSIYKN